MMLPIRDYQCPPDFKCSPLTSQSMHLYADNLKYFIYLQVFFFQNLFFLHYDIRDVVSLL